MTERECVCGHPQNQHTMFEGCCTLAYCCEVERCRCRDFRPVFDWPNEPGDWRCKMTKWEWKFLSICHFDGEGLWLVARADRFTRQRFEEAFGPAKFVKCEPNPFQEPAK